MNKCKAPKIPPILVDNIYIVKAQDKAREFVKYFCNQCKPISYDSHLPNLSYLTEQRICEIPFTNDDIVSLLCSLDTSKSSGADAHFCFVNRQQYPEVVNSIPKVVNSIPK